MARSKTVFYNIRNFRRRLGVPSIALATTGLFVVGCGRRSQSQPSSVAAASAMPGSPSVVTPPDAPSDSDSSDDSTSSTNDSGHRGNGNGNGNVGVGITGSGNTMSGSDNIITNNGRTITIGGENDGNTIVTNANGGTEIIKGPAEVNYQNGEAHVSFSPGGSYSEEITTADGVTKKTFKTKDANGNTTVTTTTTDSNGVVISSGESVNTQTTHQPVARVVAAAGVESVDVNTHTGTVAIERAQGGKQIEVHADVAFGNPQISASDAKKYAAQFTIAATLSGGTLRVRAKAPADFPKGLDFTTSYRVGVPEGMSMNLETSSGAISVHGTGSQGAITAKSGYGDIKIADSGATINAAATNGAVTIDSATPLTSISGRSDYGTLTIRADAAKIAATTSNGSVIVRGARHARMINARSAYGSVKIADCSGAIDATTSNGSVNYDGTEGGTPTDLSCSSDYGSIKATIGDSSALTHVGLTTNNGSVSLHAPSTASLNVTARTTNGSIKPDGIPGEVTRDGGVGRSFDGECNGGKTSVMLSSNYGSISIGTR